MLDKLESYSLTGRPWGLMPVFREAVGGDIDVEMFLQAKLVMRDESNVGRWEYQQLGAPDWIENWFVLALFKSPVNITINLLDGSQHTTSGQKEHNRTRIRLVRLHKADSRDIPFISS